MSLTETFSEILSEIPYINSIIDFINETMYFINNYSLDIYRIIYLIIGALILFIFLKYVVRVTVG